MRYAQNTTVAVEATQTEIIQFLKRYKADNYGFSQGGQVARVGFTLRDTRILFSFFVPPHTDPRFAKTDKGRFVPLEKQPKLAQQEERRLWRSLLLVIKAKLESVAAGIETLEEAFLAQAVLPDGSTMAEFYRTVAKPAIAAGTFPNIAGAIRDVPATTED